MFLPAAILPVLSEVLWIRILLSLRDYWFYRTHWRFGCKKMPYKKAYRYHTEFLLMTLQASLRDRSRSLALEFVYYFLLAGLKTETIMSQASMPNAAAANKQPTAGLPQIGRANRQSAPVYDEESQEQHLVDGDEEAEEEDQLDDEEEQEADSQSDLLPPKQPEKPRETRQDRLPRIEPLFPETRETKPVTGSTTIDSKLPRGFESDEHFQKYLKTLTEYDRSRYQQLLDKNKTLKEELRKIAKQTEEVIRKEKYVSRDPERERTKSL